MSRRAVAASRTRSKNMARRPATATFSTMAANSPGDAMNRSDPIDFYFSIGSLYTFLTVMRMDRVEDTTDIRFVWRPFRVRTIMQEMNNLPAAQPRKLAYAFRDVHRRAAMYGFAFEGEPPYPLR